MNQKTKFIGVSLIVAFSFFSVSSSYAQYLNKYYLSFWGAVGYANLLHADIGSAELGLPNIYKSIGGPGGLLGLGFEFQHRKFLLSVGAEFDFKNSTHKIDRLRVELGEIVIGANGKHYVNVEQGGMIDKEGDPFVMRYDFDKYRDNYSIGYVNIPLMMGARFQSIYFLAGGKFGLNVLGFANTKSVISSAGGIYPHLIEMPPNYYGGGKTSSKQDISLNYSVVASLEIGKIMFFNKNKTRFHYRIAAFADYGVLNVNPIGGKNVRTDVIPNGEFVSAPYAPDGSANVLNLQHNSIFTSIRAIDKAVNPLLVGIKFTLLFDLGNKEPCNCLEDYNSKWQRKNRMR
ncbi:MAG: hypothetical protein LBT04_00390 [Prevotellaceae bacterium]|jgi:hypothetical protein|nr:hypothetical protein [Prevotellaceae bacterium]